MLRAAQPHKAIIALSTCIALLIFWNAHKASNLDLLEWTSSSFGEESLESTHPACRSLQGADDTLVILKTGSTELDDKLRVHLRTSLRCYPHYLLFSDLEEDFRGEHIIDALSSVSADIKNNHADFDIYRRLQSAGREALDQSELSGSLETLDRGAGNTKNPGWKLDKWKFMPMVNRTFHEYPEMRWYVFLEADTYVLWPMLLRYLSLVDHTKSFYAGAVTCMGKYLFAHGGSGFVVSRPAMELVTQHYASHKAELEAFTDKEWAGDYVLGKAFKDAGVDCTDAWPHFQGDYPGLLPYGSSDGRFTGRREWCVPTISYHHMSADMVENLWDWEQQWISENQDQSLDTLTHGGMFRKYVLPQMMGEKTSWDNLSDKDELTASDVDGCRAKCEARPSCLQYSFVNESGQCKTRADPRLGKKAKGVQSGWLRDRVLDSVQDAPACRKQEWLIGDAIRQPLC